MATNDNLSRGAVIALLRRELLDVAPSTPGGRVLVGSERAGEIGWRRGWNARAESLIATLEVAGV